MNGLIYKTKTVTDIENKLMVSREWGQGGDSMEGWDWHIHITKHKIDN